MATQPEAPSSSTRQRMHTIAHYGSRKRKVYDNDGSSEGHANDSTSRVTFLHPDELINGDLDLNNPVFANHVKSLLSPTEMARPDFNVLMKRKADFIREMRSDVRDFARNQIQGIMVRQASRSQMKVKSSAMNGPTLDVVSFEMIRKSWMRDSSFENRGCIFQVTYGWFDHHPRWNIDLESEYMNMRNLMYQSTPPDPANKHQRKKSCIAKHIADIKNNIVKGIRKAGMMAHGVSITITRPSSSITQETKFKKREKGCEYHILVVQNVNNQHQQLTSLPSSLPDEQEDSDDDSNYDDADATETCASDESLMESLESIDWTIDSADNELYYLCWDSDEEMLVLGEDDNRGIASGSDSIGGSGGDSIDAGDTHHSAGNNSTADGGGCSGNGDDDNSRGIASGGGSNSIGGSGGDSIDAGDTHHSAGNNSTADGGGCSGNGDEDNHSRGIASGGGSNIIGGSGGDSIDAGDTHHSAGNNSTADGGGCCGNEDGAGANSNKGADCSIAGKEVLVPPLEQQENTKEGPSLHHSIVPRKSCWCPHDTSLNHFNTVLGLESEDQAIYCGVSKKNGQGFYLHGRKCAYCSAKFVVNATPSNNGKNEFRPTRRKPAWACKWMTKTNKVKTKCTFALCNACFIVLSTMPTKESGHYERKVNAPILTNM